MKKLDDLDNSSYELIAGLADLPSLVALCCCQRALQRRFLAIAAIWRGKRGELLTATVMSKSPAELRLLELIYGAAMRWPQPAVSEKILLQGASAAGELWKIQWLVARFGHLWTTQAIPTAFNVTCTRGHLGVAKWLFARYPTAPVDDTLLWHDIARHSPREVIEWLVTDVISADSGRRLFIRACQFGRPRESRWIADYYGLMDSNFKNKELVAIFEDCNPLSVELFAVTLALRPNRAKRIAVRVRKFGNAAAADWLDRYAAAPN